MGLQYLRAGINAITHFPDIQYYDLYEVVVFFLIGCHCELKR